MSVPVLMFDKNDDFVVLTLDQVTRRLLSSTIQMLTSNCSCCQCHLAQITCRHPVHDARQRRRTFAAAKRLHSLEQAHIVYRLEAM